MHKKHVCEEYLTIQELASIVSQRAADLRSKGVEVKGLGTIIRDLVKEHPYATASAIGKELNLHRQRIKHERQLIEQEEMEEAFRLWEEEKEIRKRLAYLEDARQHEKDMLKDLWKTGHDRDDI